MLIFLIFFLTQDSYLYHLIAFKVLSSLGLRDLNASSPYPETVSVMLINS